MKFYIQKNNKIFIILPLITFVLFSLFFINKEIENNKRFLHKITEIFNKEGKVNINAIESILDLKKKEQKKIKIINKSTIHVGFTLDKGFLLQTMITVASIMATQSNNTKIIFHFGVVQNFTSLHMLKIYQLRNKLNNLTEFNFYYLKGAIEKMKGFHPKGEACPGKFELTELLPNNVERLLLFDAGDVLIFRDLKELYNYDMKNYWVLGTPEPIGIFMNRKYNLTKFVNIGSLLINVKKLKIHQFWNLYTKNKNLKLSGAKDQSLFNILIPDKYKDYIPFKFGGLSPFKNDKNSDKLLFTDHGQKKLLKSKMNLPFPKDTHLQVTAQLYNPVFIHQWNGKWFKGKGLSIFRNLAKYFINIAGIWNEVCKTIPGYCK